MDEAEHGDAARARGFYEAHRRFFETDERQIEHPFFPVHGRWKVDAVGLPKDVLEKLYFRNAQRIIPGFGE